MRFENEARQQYIIANDKAVRAQRSNTKKDAPAHPVVLDSLFDRQLAAIKMDMGIIEIPTSKIVGLAADNQKEITYAQNFMPLASSYTEFAQSWRYLYQKCLTDQGLLNPIRCYEYLGNFYVQDGAKRVSVLKHSGAATIFSEVIRIMPTCIQDLKVHNYYEFLNHFRMTRLYQVSFTRPENFAKLQKALGYEANYHWNDTDRFGFLYYWYTIENAYHKAFEDSLNITAADALVVLLEKYTYQQIIKMPVWVLSRVFQVHWKELHELSVQEFSLEKRQQRLSGALQTA